MLLMVSSKNWSQTDKEIIRCASHYGPVFGSGYLWAHALSLGDIFNSKVNSTTDGIGGEYSTEGTDKSTLEESTNTDFHQWNNGRKMVQSDRYEVFAVQWQQ